MLTNWFSSILSPDSESDLEGSLTSDLDGSLLGLGMDMAGNGFNINESLMMSLPLCKQENGGGRSSCSKRKNEDREGVQFIDGTAVMENTSPTILTHRGHSVSDLKTHNQWVNLADQCNGVYATINNNNAPQFQYILMTPTSPATKLNEETQTYLNQGHSYEIKLKRLGDMEGYGDGQLFRSVVRVIFHERRLQCLEREQLENWRQTRPGERLADIDIPLSYGLVDVAVDPRRLNCVDFLWNPQRDTGVFVKIHCISTEFTAKKHGGEKGVPFRLQVETYRHDAREPLSTASSSVVVHCGSCQIKVFKPKGADRKQKTDREKVDRRSDADREKYQPPYEYTVLSEMPLDQISMYLDQLNNEDNKTNIKTIFQQQQQQSLNKTNVYHGSFPNLHRLPLNNGGQTQQQQPPQASPHPYCRSLSLRSVGSPLIDCGASKIHQLSQVNAMPSGESNQNLVDSSSFDYTRSISTPSSTNSSSSSSSTMMTTDSLLSSATEIQVCNWLTNNKFTHLISAFQNFSGFDILRLSRKDMIDICGLSDGIRLNNALMTRSVPPLLTLFICEKPKGLNDNFRDLKLSQSSNSSDAVPSTQMSPMTTVATNHRSHDDVPTVSNQHGHEFYNGNSVVRTACSSPTDLTCPSSCFNIQTNNNNNNMERLPQLVRSSSKRQLMAKDEDDNYLHQPIAKKQCVRASDIVYSAIYLEHLTSQCLVEQLAAEQNLSAKLIQNIRIRMSSGITVLVSNSVVRNFTSESKFFFEIIQDDSSTGLCHLLLMPVVNTS